MRRSRSKSASLSLLACLCVVGACSADQPQASDHADPERIPARKAVPDSITGYDFGSADVVFELDKDLKEISGLTFYDDRHLAAVEDERGRFYLIDVQTGAIVSKKKFGKKGDYEGIERVDDRLFVLRSDGQVVEVLDFTGDDPDGDLVKTPLGSWCDAEGLGYDTRANRLLVACKEHPGRGLRHRRAVYALTLESMEMIDDPVMLIHSDSVAAMFGAEAPPFADLVAPLIDIDRFKPAALAIHPITDQVFVVSSVLKVIVVVDRQGTTVAAARLDEELFEQPEGLAFLPNGDLFVSSEGRKQSARLVRFNYRASPRSTDL